MASFVYVGRFTKPGGTVDVKLRRCSHGVGPLEFRDVVPGTTLITVEHECHVNQLRQTKEPPAYKARQFKEQV